MESPFFIKNNSQSLFTILHEPDIPQVHHSSPPDLSHIGIVFCHSFAEEKLFTHRVMVNIARELTKEGAYCLRFDYMGHGDSEGNFEDATIDTRISDIHCVLKHLKNTNQIKKICILGVRLGATLSVLATTNSSEIDAAILISPVINGKRYINNCLRSNLSTQMTVYKKIVKDRKALISDLMADQLINIDGYRLTKKLYQQIEAINLQTVLLQSVHDVLLIDITPGKNKPVGKELNELYAQYNANKHNVQLSSIDQQRFWNEVKVYTPYVPQLQKEIVKWLRIVFS